MNNRRHLIFIGVIIVVILVFYFFFARDNRIVRVSDGNISFSFKVPSSWAVETRHSGERKLFVEEMRAFLSTGRNERACLAGDIYPDYCDMPVSKIKELSDEQIKRMFFRSPDEWLPYPNASVADGKNIIYSDTAWTQVDLYIFHGFKLKRTYFNEMLNDEKMEGLKRTSCYINGIKATVLTFPLDKDDKGDPIVTKAGTGRIIYYIPLNNGKDMIVINKQAKGDAKFESAFAALLRSIRIK